MEKYRLEIIGHPVCNSFSNVSRKKKKAYLYTHMEKDRETKIEMPQISEILTENLGEGALGVLCTVLEMFL